MGEKSGFGYYILQSQEGNAHSFQRANDLAEQAVKNCPPNTCPLFPQSQTVEMVYGRPFPSTTEHIVLGEDFAEIHEYYQLQKLTFPKDSSKAYIRRLYVYPEKQATPVEMTPELEKIFTELAPVFLAQIESWNTRYEAAYDEALKKARENGFVGDRPEIPTESENPTPVELQFIEERNTAAINFDINMFTAANITPPSLPIVEVFGVENILQNIH